MKSKEYPSREFFESRMSYDPETGVFTWINGSHFSGKRAGYATKPQGYMCVCMDGNRTFKLHRVALIMSGIDIPDDMDVDHINRKVDDNRLCNLRIASRSDNAKNQLKKNKRGFSGVTMTKKGHLAVRITDRNRVRQTRYNKFRSESDAAMYRDAWNIRENGDFAATNFPRSLYFLVVKTGPHSQPPY